MKLSLAVLSTVCAKRDPDAERRLEKIRGKAAEYKTFAENNDNVSTKRLKVINERVDRLVSDLERIDVSACPSPGVEEDKFSEGDEEFSELCDASGKFPSMVRSYARTFGCQDGFPNRNFLERLVNRSHKLKRKTKKAAKCDAPAAVTTATSIVTGTPFTNPPMLEMCDEGFHAECDELTNSEIYFENQWTCRNCFRVRATYGQNSGFKFNPAKGDFVSVRFTEPVVWQTFNHPVKKVTEVGDDNTWKIDFKHDGNFMSGMIFEGNLQTSDDNLHVDGNWIIESAQQCSSREVFGDRYFTLWARPDGGIKFNAPLKNNGEFHEVEYNHECTPGEWNTYTVLQQYVDSVLELSVSVNEEVLGTHVVPVRKAFQGELFVEVAGDYHPAADTFKVRNFFHQTFSQPTSPCGTPVDPCDGDDSCDALVWNCPIRPEWSNLLGEVKGNAVYSASVDVLC
ncbi:Oidioi.mRNA.OKI2018_I69.PAR.g12906.t1.cds [Oikopleura dioica]|uniref:Oidioi.mRNA.OKI2018_I69.PAR.g12906.t1.cds n=1 Tax=Oikopleura dioica TaxID=34765 RepID=A0ABN7S266_OIKDI|nr:Oidioi.mRNA.OKI2018_I69.PAR.g12906.t1.cds [Oikopleura dioica]